MKDEQSLQINKTIVLTGSTGTFGKFLVSEFLKYSDVRLILLIRNTAQLTAEERAQSIVDTEKERVEVFKADLTKENLGLSEAQLHELAKRTTHIIHSAASTRFTLPLEEARIHNLKNTERIIDFAKTCPQLVRFGFVSTALVAGKRSGVIQEDDFEHSAGFNNSYQQTKYEAEALVRASNLPIVIFRPPFIVTPTLPNSPPGATSFLNVLISLVAQERLPSVPGSEKSTMDIVAAPDASRIIVQLMLKEKLSHVTYHITNGTKAFSIHTLHQMIEKKCAKRIPVEYCGDMESFLKRVDQISKQKPELETVYKRAESFLVEPAYPKIFDNTHTLSELGVSQVGKDPVDIFHLMLNDDLWSSSN